MAQKKQAPKSGNTAQIVETLITPVIEQLGLRLWDVRFEKEGPDWFLRVYIDRDTPLDTDACEAASRAIDPVIDAADPISQSYYMEVGSPGLGRRLTREAHFAAKQGQKVSAHLYRADQNGNREIAGILLGKEGAELRLETEEQGTVALDMKEITFVKLCDDEDLF